MNELWNIKYIKDTLASHGFTFKKQLGQNFLINPSVCPRMAESAVIPGGGVLEVGPGIGVLTRELSALAKKVVAVELDPRLQPVLCETLKGCENVKVVEGDILKIDLKSLIKNEFDGMPISVAANLPYYITSPVIMRLLEERLPIESITVMVQREAALRLSARPGVRDCGAVSVAVRVYSEPKILFNVSRGSFMPAPNVDSAVIRLDILKEPLVPQQESESFFKVVRAAFSQRRKTLLNSLSGGLSLPKEAVLAAADSAGIDPSRRAETLSVEEFYRLTVALGAVS